MPQLKEKILFLWKKPNMKKDIGRQFHWRKHYKKSRFRKSITRDIYNRIIYYEPWAIEWVL